MSNPSPSRRDRIGLLAELVRDARVCWRLFWDRRVPGWTKLVPLATLVYILFPVDLLPDPALGLGQVDDLGLLLLGLKLFVTLIPAPVVEQVRREMGYGVAANPADGGGPTVEITYRAIEGGSTRRLPGGEETDGGGKEQP